LWLHSAALTVNKLTASVADSLNKLSDRTDDNEQNVELSE